MRADYTAEKGQPFTHFFCPMLFRDEETELLKGHIVNEAFPDSSSKRIMQRKDIDNFYGTHFEADFIDILRVRGMTVPQIMTDKSLSRKLSPKLFFDGKEVEHFYSIGKHMPPGSSMAVAVEGMASSIPFGLRMEPELAAEAAGKKWEIELNGDMRVAMVVSVLKSAYLTLFDMLGYRYALSTAGISVGYSLLGRFFHENRGNKRTEIATAALSFFRGCAHMVRPLLYHNFEVKGTVSDHVCLICRGTSGSRWGIIIFVRTGDLIHCVLMPAYENEEDAISYYGFLENDHESIHASIAEYGDGVWNIQKDSMPLNWQKKGILYP